MLGASAYWGYGNDKFSMTNALRYKTTAYLLGSLDTEGEYEPSDFADNLVDTSEAGGGTIVVLGEGTLILLR